MIRKTILIFFVIVDHHAMTVKDYDTTVNAFPDFFVEQGENKSNFKVFMHYKKMIFAKSFTGK